MLVSEEGLELRRQRCRRVVKNPNRLVSSGPGTPPLQIHDGKSGKSGKSGGTVVEREPACQRHMVCMEFSPHTGAIVIFVPSVQLTRDLVSFPDGSIGLMGTGASTSVAGTFTLRLRPLTYIRE